MKTKILIIIVLVVIAVAGITYTVYSEIPRYGATVEGAPKTNPVCDGTIQHGFFSKVQLLKN